MLLESMHRELSQRKDYLEDESVETIYFGGGTPSLLEEKEIVEFIDAVYKNFRVASDPEITLEANPDDLSLDKLVSLKRSGINRLSIGVQSFHEEDLRLLNRAHSADQALKSILNAQETGIDNITIDLIYGIPGQVDNQWEKNLEQVRSLGIPHLSAYSLTVEPRTQLEYLVRKRILPAVDEEQTARHFIMLMDWAEASGFEHYEISNFCLPGKYSRHNSSYWLGKKYLGIGPSAHSYNGFNRQWNMANNSLYVRKLNSGESYSEMEALSVEQQFNEYIMISLRTHWGCDLSKIRMKFGDEYVRYITKNTKPFIDKAQLRKENDLLILSRAGKLLADSIISDLFIV